MAARLSSALLRTQPDRRLTALAAGGSEPAFEALVERYRRPLQAYCRRLLLDASSAEDVVQQAFLSTWQSLSEDDRQIADVKAWLYRLVHNGAVNALKRSGYRHEELTDALSGAGAPEDDLERRIAIRKTLAGLAALPELQREALLLTAVEGQTHEDVARELGLTDGAVRGLVFRARSTLRAAAGALFPAPLIAWLASAEARASTPERIAEIVGGGGASVAAVVLKSSAAVITTAALAGGAVVAERKVLADPPTARAAQVAERATPAATSGAAGAATAATPATGAAGDTATGSSRRGDGNRPGAGPDGASPQAAGDPAATTLSTAAPGGTHAAAGPAAAAQDRRGGASGPEDKAPAREREKDADDAKSDDVGRDDEPDDDERKDRPAESGKGPGASSDDDDARPATDKPADHEPERPEAPDADDDPPTPAAARPVPEAPDVDMPADEKSGKAADVGLDPH